MSCLDWVMYSCTDGMSSEGWIPSRVGVPTDPIETGVTLAIRTTITAARAGNPRDSNKGAASAAGVPNPADPLINPPKSQALMMACTRLSAEIQFPGVFQMLMARTRVMANARARDPTGFCWRDQNIQKIPIFLWLR